MINFGLWIAYILIVLCIVSVVLFPIKSLLQNPKSAKNAGIGLGALVVVFLLSLMLSGGVANDKFHISAGESKMIGAGITMLYFLAIGTVGLTLYTEVIRFFKK
jgi:high-affinity nickel permease